MSSKQEEFWSRHAGIITDRRLVSCICSMADGSPFGYCAQTLHPIHTDYWHGFWADGIPNYPSLRDPHAIPHAIMGLGPLGRWMLDIAGT
jgi:hypothetical protein